MATETTPEATPDETDERVAGLRRHVTVADRGHEEVPVEAPFTGERIGSIPQCERPDVDEAVESARTAQAEWEATPVGERAAVVRRLHDVVLDRQAELMDVVQLEAGKSRRDAHEEVMDLVATARHYAHRARGYLDSERRKGAIPLLTRTEVHHHPKGVVGMISPWNYPLTLTLSEAVPALLAGNAVVVNPAEQTPYTALKGKELLVEAGLPPDCFQVVTGHGEPIGEPLVERVEYVSFTGSTAVGREIGALAGEHLVDCSLELGGNNAALVLDDADVGRAVEGLLAGCFSNAGQLCISFERIYVDETLYDEFLEAFVAATSDLTLGTSFTYDDHVGSLISERHLEKVRRHVADAVDAGATVEVGGEHRPDVGPYAFEPTVLTGVTEEMTVRDVETFGPVVWVAPVESVDEAVRRTNDTDYGLNGSVWTGDATRGRDIARRIEAGTVGVNDAYVATWGSMGAPMGGMKDSGIGRRHGEEGFYKYTEPQTVATQRLVPAAAPPDIDYERYVAATTRILKVVERIPGLR